MNTLSSLSLGLLLAVAFGCKTPDELAPKADPTASNPDWTAASHGREAAPDYTVVFPQDRVNTLEITMTADQWKTIQTDMTAKYGGAFGAGGTMGVPGGQPGQFGKADPAYVPLTVRFNGRRYNQVGFRLKGNSSLSASWRQGVYKLPFRLKMDEFEDQYPEIDNQRLYGFQELSMSPAYSDPSLIREKLAADLFLLAGVPAARTAFYKVYIDFGSGRQYCGVYTMVEVIDDTMVADQFGEKEGNIYKPESTFQSFNQSQFEKKNNETAADYTDVRAFITALNAGNRTTDRAARRAGLEKTFNVDHFLRYLAVNNTIVNWDSYGAMAHNYYLYHAPAGKLTWIPWDHNMSMPNTVGSGQGGGGMGGRRAGSLAMTEVGAGWPLLRYVADDPVYYARYKQYVKQFAQSVFTTARVNALADQYHSLITPYVTGTEAEKAPYSFLSNASAFTTALPQLKSHVAARVQAAADFVN